MTHTIDTYTGAYDSKNIPRAELHAGVTVYMHESPDARELDAFLATMRGNDLDLEYVHSEHGFDVYVLRDGSPC